MKLSSLQQRLDRGQRIANLTSNNVRSREKFPVNLNAYLIAYLIAEATLTIVLYKLLSWASSTRQFSPSSEAAGSPRCHLV